MKCLLSLLFRAPAHVCMATSELRAKRILSVITSYSSSGFLADHCGLAFCLGEFFEPAANTNPIASITHEVHLLGELFRGDTKSQPPARKRSTKQARRSTRDKLPNGDWNVSHFYGPRMKKPAASTGVGGNDLWPLSARLPFFSKTFKFQRLGSASSGPIKKVKPTRDAIRS